MGFKTHLSQATAAAAAVIDVIPKWHGILIH